MIEIEVKGKDKEKEKEYGKYEDYEVEGWARTIMEAEEIKNDPEKMKYAKMCMDKKMKAMESAYSSIADLRKKAKELSSKDEEYES